MITQVKQASGNGKLILKIVEDEVSTIIEIHENNTNGMHPFELSELTIEQFDAIGSDDVDVFGIAAIENNRNFFDKLFAFIN